MRPRARRAASPPRLAVPIPPLAGLALAAALAAVAVLPAPRAEAGAAIRDDGLLVVDGSPFFPVGLVEVGPTRYADWEDRIRDAGANLVWDIELAYADTTPSCAAIVAAAEAGGWKLLVGSGDTWNWDVPGTPELEVDRHMYEPDETARLEACLAAAPGVVVGWANRDEPVWTISRSMVGDIDSAHVYETYHQLRGSRFPAPVAMNFAPAHLSLDRDEWKKDIVSMRDATDVMMFAAYPYPAGPGTCGEWNVVGYPECAMDRLADAADIFLGELNRPDQPLWMIVQAFKDIPLREARWEAYAAIVHGATGVFWAGWTWVHPLGDGTTTWPVTRAVMAEVSSLQPFLVGTDIGGALVDEPDVDVRVKRSAEGGTEAVLFAVSRRHFSGTARIRLPRAIANRAVEVVGEGRTLVPDADGWITDEFEAYEAHVYRYDVPFGQFVDPIVPTGVDDPVPTAGPFRLSVRPVPSRGPVTARFELPGPTAVAFSVVDAAGRRVARLGSGTWDAAGELAWDGRTAAGTRAAPGVYFLRGRTADGRTATARIVLQR